MNMDRKKQVDPRRRFRSVIDWRRRVDWLFVVRIVTWLLVISVMVVVAVVPLPEVIVQDWLGDPGCVCTVTV